MRDYKFSNQKLRNAVKMNDIEAILAALKSESFHKRDVLNLFKFGMENDNPRLIKHLIQDEIEYIHWYGKRKQHFNLNRIKTRHHTIGEAALNKAIDKHQTEMVELLSSKVNLNKWGTHFLEKAIDSCESITVDPNRKTQKFSESAQIHLIKNGARPLKLHAPSRSQNLRPTQSQAMSTVSRCVRFALARDQYDLVTVLWRHQLFPRYTELASCGLLKSAMMQGNMRMVNFLCNGGYQVGTKEIIDVIGHLQDESRVCEMLDRILEQNKIYFDIESGRMTHLNLDTVLEYAVIMGKRILVPYLIHSGASPDVINSSLFCELAEKGAHKMIKFLVIRYAFEPSRNHQALLNAAICGHIKTVKTLLELGVNSLEALQSAYEAVLEHEQKIMQVIEHYPEYQDECIELQQMKHCLEKSANEYGYSLRIVKNLPLIFASHQDIHQRFNPKRHQEDSTTTLSDDESATNSNSSDKAFNLKTGDESYLDESSSSLSQRSSNISSYSASYS